MLKIFGFPTSPYVRKVLLVAALKRIPFDLDGSTPHKPSAGFLAASPFKMMPAMEDDGFTLADSTAIAFYLDAKHPQPALMPTSPQARGRAMLFDEFADTVLAGPARTIGFNRYIGPQLLGLPANEEAAMEAELAAQPHFDWLEEQMPQTGFLLGDTLSLADISVAACLRTMAYGMDVKSRPLTSAWLTRIEALPSWNKTAILEAEMVENAIQSGAHSSS